MRLMPTSALLTWTQPMFISKPAYNCSKMDSPRQAHPTATPLCPRMFILRPTNLRRFMVQLLPSGALPNLSSHHRVQHRQRLVAVDGTVL
jgi:hypothetical protein